MGDGVVRELRSRKRSRRCNCFITGGASASSPGSGGNDPGTQVSNETNE